MTAVYVAAGSNVDPIVNLRLALTELRTHYQLRVSPAYRNQAVGFEGDDFVNLVVGFDTELPVEAVLETLHAAEAACGRPRDAAKWAPRTMDLDLLLYGDLVRPELRIPRADLLKRAFMLRPMAELAPYVVHSVVKKSMRALWEEFDDAGHSMTPVQI